MVAKWKVYPLTPGRWQDLVALFGERGACGGCWCMTPRLTRSEYERYPVEPKKRPMPPVFAWPGIASVYRQAGFREVARPSETRPIMRRTLPPPG